jgi:hypothetical protein
VNHILLAAFALAAGCSFDPGQASNHDMSTGGDDLAGVADMVPLGPDLTTVCTPGDSTCTGGMLSVCNDDGTAFDNSTCEIGCNTSGVACLALQPTPPAIASDFVYAGLTEPTIAASQTLLVFDVDSGEIKDGSGANVRMPNTDPMARNVENGIGFHVVTGVGIWTFAKLTVPATATIVFKHSAAAAGAAILSASDLTIAGTLDARGYMDPTQVSTLCTGTVAGPGGTIGASGATAATGTGAGGSAADATTGGGGAGYGAGGGIGGNHGGTLGGTAGATAGASTINPLAGGFGGGCSGTAGTTNGGGGGGGGALQLAAEGTITVSGGINAGGCGGSAGAAAHGGGGGGSGGAVLIEAPTVHVTATGVLAANGGGGGAGGDATSSAGTPGKTSEDPAGGGTGGSAGGAGGALGATAGVQGTGGNGAGGGGGGVGRVRLNSSAGAALDTNSTVSPPASPGTVVVQ